MLGPLRFMRFPTQFFVAEARGSFEKRKETEETDIEAEIKESQEILGFRLLHIFYVTSL